MNHYETVFILTPVLSEAQMKEAVEKFTKVLTDNGSTIVNEENWGLRKLAYPIDKKTTGFYTLIEFDADPTIINKLETAYRRDERIIRFLTLRLDKYAAEYAAKRRSLKAAKANAPEEATADVPEEEVPAKAPKKRATAKAPEEEAPAKAPEEEVPAKAPRKRATAKASKKEAPADAPEEETANAPKEEVKED